jgi:membrane-bound ClpP family serine protease
MVLLNPIAWTHTLILLLLPAALIMAERTQSRVLLLGGMIVATVPRQLLYALAGSIPVGPWRGTALSLHAAAAAAVVAAALRTPPEAE